MSREALIQICPEDCCIYRVPLDQRLMNPRAYRPRAVLIGPLTHDKKQEALKVVKEKCTSQETENIINRCKQYLSMESQKLRYYQSFQSRIGADAMTELKSYIETNTKKIRDCYAESTTWIDDNDFVNLILHDAIFIIEFLLRSMHRDDEYRGDLVVRTGLRDLVMMDLCLLENQVPLYVLKKASAVLPEKFLEESIICLSSRNKIRGDISDGREFKHITDLIRYPLIRSVDTERNAPVEHVDWTYNVEQLLESGVDFKVMKEEPENSINMRFENRELKMACFFVDEHTEIFLRNIMALEQCHYPDEMYMCNYLSFLDFLIDTEKDVEILEDKGIIKNFLGNASMVKNMINNLCYEVAIPPSCYSDIADKLNKHHVSLWNRSMAALRHNYFNNVWKGTATVGGVVLLLLSLIQTIASIIQVKQGINKRG